MKYSLIALLLLAAMTLAATDPTPAAPMTGKDSVVIDGLCWYTSLEAAEAVAATNHMPIFVDFTGSDWCIWCQKLHSEVLSTPEFHEYAQTNLVLVIVDFPRGFKQLPQADQDYRLGLQNHYGIKGYPTVLLLNADGTVIANTGYMEGGPQQYIPHLQQLLNPSSHPDEGGAEIK